MHVPSKCTIVMAMGRSACALIESSGSNRTQNHKIGS